MAQTSAVSSSLLPEGLEGLSERIGHRFADHELLRRAMAHRSWCAEHPGHQSNERLEFLGDAVLGWMIADIAYREHQDLPEGKLTDLRKSVVNASALAEIAIDVDLGACLLLGKGESAAGGRFKPSILSDALEAVIGAVYLDAGYDAAAALVRRLFENVEINAQMQAIGKDPKTELQEWLQGRKMSLPIYRVVGTQGAAHKQIFDVECEIAEYRRAERGIGGSRRAGEQAAATAMLAYIKTLDA